MFILVLLCADGIAELEDAPQLDRGRPCGFTYAEVRDRDPARTYLCRREKPQLDDTAIAEGDGEDEAGVNCDLGRRDVIQLLARRSCVSQ